MGDYVVGIMVIYAVGNLKDGHKIIFVARRSLSDFEESYLKWLGLNE